jgi:hypothetical protein
MKGVITLGKKRKAYMILMGKPSQKERDHKEDLDLGGWIILRQILQS